MKSAVLLLTMRCNIACAHCSVDSHPRRTDRMPRDRALHLVRGLCRIPGIEFIDVSGGEPLLYQDDLAALAAEVRRRGKRLRVVTNGFWAAKYDRAVEVLGQLRDAGIESVAVSIDDWHLEFISPEVIRNFVKACRHLGMIPMVSLVVATPPAAGDGGRFPDSVVVGLRRYGIEPDECFDMYQWGVAREAQPAESRASYDADVSRRFILVTWQTLTAEGRARSLNVATVPFDDSRDEPCDIAGRLPTVDSEGRLFPCCSPWINRAGHAIARVDGDTVGGAVRAMIDEPLIRIIHDQGPKRLIDAARRRGIEFPARHSGICNQCGLLMDRLTLSELRSLASEVVEEDHRTRLLTILGLRQTHDVTANQT